MRFDILTIFPELIESYCGESILKRAQQKKLASYVTHDLRDYTDDSHRSVDDRPYGGGAGMVLKIEPMYRALKKIRALPPAKNQKHRVILLTPQGKTFTQRHAERLVKYQRVTLIAGRYEGFDERVRSIVDEQLSIGDYVLTGGELPALVVIDAITRLIPGVLGHAESNRDETFSRGEDDIEYPHYSRPEIFRGKKVPSVLLSGDHAAIKRWREQHRRKK
ncbi:MAG: tRNA (guanosine(37)-N1)-methyltransferase TrmD [bacterium]|nr:tRNA (guanosine(37)-N1)-methyltransferase TrmD [bacterium]